MVLIVYLIYFRVNPIMERSVLVDCEAVRVSSRWSQKWSEEPAP